MTKTFSFAELEIKAKAKVYTDGRPLALTEHVANGTLPDGNEFDIVRDIPNQTYYIEVKDGNTYAIGLRDIMDGLIEARK